MVYGKDNTFNAERIIDLLDAFEDFKVCLGYYLSSTLSLSHTVERVSTLLSSRGSTRCCTHQETLNTTRCPR